MKYLAALVRKGLETPSVVEDSKIWGAGTYEGKTLANVVGLALIGKIGVDRSLTLFEKACEEMYSEKSAAAEEINLELEGDFPLFESMVTRHFQVSAAQVAEELEKGTLAIT